MAAVIRIEIQSTGGVQEVKKDVADLGRAAEESGKGFSALKEIGVGALRAIGAGAVDLAVKGFQAVAGAISDGIADAKQNAQIQAQTAAVLKSTGEAAGVSAQHIADYASSLSDAAGKSLFGDDQIQQSTNLLLTFTEIKGATLDAATAISVDMAQALGGAPKDAAIQLGKALNDPIKGITALTRVGVTFSEEQRATIQAMQEAGDTAGAQAVILAELNKEFGGSAAAAAAATGGWSEFNGRMGEAKEALGAAVLPLLNSLAGVLNTSVLPIIETAAQAFGRWVAIFQEGGLLLLINQLAFELFGVRQAFTPVYDAVLEIIGAFQDAGPLSSEFGEAIGYLATQLGLPGALIQNIVAAIQNVIGAFSGGADSASGFGKVINDLASIWQALQPVIVNVANAVWGVVSAIFAQIQTFLHAHGDDIKAFLGQTWDAIVTIIKIAIALINATIVPFLTAIAAAISAHGADIQRIFTDVWNIVKGVIDAALTLIRGILQAALQAIHGDWSGAWETIKTMSARFVQDLWEVIRAGLDLLYLTFRDRIDEFIGQWNNLVRQASDIGRNIIDGIIHGVENGIGALKDAVSNAAQSALNAAKRALGISSPSQVFADQLGKPMVTGIIQGVQEMVPQLNVLIDELTSNLMAQLKTVNKKTLEEVDRAATELANKIEALGNKTATALNGAFSGVATLDRAKAKAIENLKSVSEEQQQVVKGELAALTEVTAQMTNPEDQGKWFQMRTQQIFEIAKLRDQISKETNADAKARLQEQIALIAQAQEAEQSAFVSKQTTSPLESILEQIRNIMKTPGLPGTDMVFALSALEQQVMAAQTMTTNTTSSFVYSPTITTTSTNGALDLATARSLSGI